MNNQNDELTIECPCGSGVGYAKCCYIAHQNHSSVKTAESLMRSRYSAFVLKLNQYLLASWHPSTRPVDLDLSDDETYWLKLEVLRCQAGGSQDLRGKVEFKAYYQTPDGQTYLHELSRFKRERGLWFYVDGKVNFSR